MKKRITMWLALLFLALAPLCAWAQGEGKEHYLLVGVDGWGLSEEGDARSDAIILATLDHENSEIVLVSFARDSLVRPSYRKGLTKLNTLVRSTEGDQTLVTYMEETFGLPISGYFLVNFSGAVDVINAIGGVDVELTDEEMHYIHANTDEYADYPLKAGVCRLNGAQALTYMRCRELDNDFGRQSRQSNVLRAAFRKLSSLAPVDALLTFYEVLGMYRTDMTLLDQAALAKDALTLRGAQIVTHSLPADGTYKYGVDASGASGLLFDLPQNQRLMREWLGMEPLAAAE